MVEDTEPGATFSMYKRSKEIKVSRVSIIRTMLCSKVWFVRNHTKFESLKTCKPFSEPSYGQFIILMYAILMYGQFMTFIQSYITYIHSTPHGFVFISWFFYGQPELSIAFFFRKYYLTEEDVTIVTFTASNTPQFMDLNFEGNIKSKCQLDFNCFFEKRNSFSNIYKYTGKQILAVATVGYHTEWS